MSHVLNMVELISLVGSVFSPGPKDRVLGLLVDVPRDPEVDSQRWRERRDIAEGWRDILQAHIRQLGLDSVRLFAYPDVGSNNADLPDSAYEMGGPLPPEAKGLPASGRKTDFSDIFSTCQLLMAPTEYSTTAPLKNAAKQYGFRAATMPGFISDMIPALRIDYNEVNRRCRILKERLDPAVSADVKFLVDGVTEYSIHFDLRFRTAHMSSGRFPDSGIAGNLPSGETYIVPYEGERFRDDPSETFRSRTNGELPVESDGKVVVFSIRENRAVEVTGESPLVEAEAEHLAAEPAYGNMAELGFGILGDFGLKPIQEILLDEKLGFHVAFGRSDHFGGDVGPKRFSHPGAVIHLDRIYIPATQPRIHLMSVTLNDPEDRRETIIRDGAYLLFE